MSTTYRRDTVQQQSCEIKNQDHSLETVQLKSEETG